MDPILTGILTVFAFVTGVVSAAFSFLLWKAFSRAVSVDVLASLKVIADRVSELYARKSPLSSSFESDALDMLRRLDERVQAPPKPTLPPETQVAYFDQLIREAYDLGEKMGANNAANGVKVTGKDKQREAISYLRRNLETVSLDPDFHLPLLARKLEAEVVRRKEGQS